MEAIFLAGRGIADGIGARTPFLQPCADSGGEGDLKGV